MKFSLGLAVVLFLGNTVEMLQGNHLESTLLWCTMSIVLALGYVADSIRGKK